MADETYNQHVEKETPVDADFIPIWDVAGGTAAKTLRSALVGATLIGEGTIDTGGNTLVIADSGTLDIGGHTLLYDEDTWVPVIMGAGGDPTITYSTQAGKYTRMGNVVFFNLQVSITTIAGGSGQLRISLPLAVSSIGGASQNNTNCTVRINNVNLTGTPIGVVFLPISGQSYGLLQSEYDNASATNEEITALTNGSTISASGFYFV